MHEAIAMVNGQLRPNDITNSMLLNAMSQIDRKFFVPESEKECAYIDSIIKINEERYLLSPLIIALMIQSLNIKTNEKVLDLACGNGYSSCVLSYLADKVFAIDKFSDLLKTGKQYSLENDSSNIRFIKGELINSAEEEFPYDKILISGSANHIPKKIFDFLKPNGKLVTIVKKHPNIASIVLFKKSDNLITSEKILETNAPVIYEFKKQKTFTLQ